MKKRVNQQQSGMRGVFLAAAELTRREWIVSATARNAQSADLMITNADGSRVFAVQVKTNTQRFGFWLMSKSAVALKSPLLVYVLVNIRKDRTEYFCVPSAVVARNIRIDEASSTRKKTAYSLYEDKISEYRDQWTVIEA